MNDYHISVLLQEAIDGLDIQPGKKYIDATLGAGGHSLEILKKGGIVLAIDQDTDAIEYVTKQISNIKYQISNIKLIRGNFSKITEIAKENGFVSVAGVLFDLGVSSHQLDDAQRGFSFMKDAPLDMRMDKSLGVVAKDLVNGLHKGELTELFARYGEEPFGKRIAEKIVEKREIKPIERTTELAEIVRSVYPRGISKIHPATKVFQALRIAVNDELVSLEIALPQGLSLLEKHGRIVVISFHSLEDRLVKHMFTDWEEKGLGKIVTKKPIEPSEEEIERNRKSRSSKLRIFEKN